jgi:hypothetical protein
LAFSLLAAEPNSVPSRLCFLCACNSRVSVHADLFSLAFHEHHPCRREPHLLVVGCIRQPMASYRLHCWVKEAADLKVPPIGAWAPTLRLRCGVAEAHSEVEDVLNYAAGGKGFPVFLYYLRVPVVSPLDKDIVVSVVNAKAIGKGKLGSVVVPIKALIRGVPIGFRWFKLLSKKGKLVGNLHMRVMVQYPETLTLPPNALSNAALKRFNLRGAPNLLKLGVHQLEGISAPHGLKLNLLNKDAKIQALCVRPSSLWWLCGGRVGGAII